MEEHGVGVDSWECVNVVQGIGSGKFLNTCLNLKKKEKRFYYRLNCGKIDIDYHIKENDD